MQDKMTAAEGAAEGAAEEAVVAADAAAEKAGNDAASRVTNPASETLPEAFSGDLRGRFDDERDDDRLPRKRSPQRVVNAWFALALCLIFAAHALLGAIKVAWPGLPASFAWVVWIGVGLAVLHIIMSGVTTYDMWTDTVRPASPRKKRHQWLKWITGGLILVCAAMHMALTLNPGLAPGAHVVRVILMILLAGSLGWHIFTSAKSLLKDLAPKVSKRTRLYVRIGVVAFFAAVGIILIVALA